MSYDCPKTERCHIFMDCLAHKTSKLIKLYTAWQEKKKEINAKLSEVASKAGKCPPKLPANSTKNAYL